jgi:hypothetical protein
MTTKSWLRTSRIVISDVGRVQSNKALQATAAALGTVFCSWFIVPFGCAQVSPSAAVPELFR